VRILEYVGFDASRFEAKYRRVREAIARGDFRAAQVKKLASLTHGKFYRAKLDDANRLLFSLVRHGEEVCALMLEVIEGHDYDRSRFLRGAAIDEAKVPDAEPAAERAEARPLRYLHPERAAIHLLDKPISFDDAQEAVYRRPPPLIVVGSAGSGKTALTLEKLKHAEGEVLYVTHSAYLAQCARDLYYANGFEHPGQDATFLSYREFVESVRVPQGREAGWREFAGWFARMRQQFRDLDAHQAFEEIRGVVAAQAEGPLSREAYLALGVRQSIFAGEARERLYDLFGKYRAWLREANLYDLNLLAHERLAAAAPRYDFVVIDEVQDITPVQLALVLKTLKRPGQFLLCGDSNQIVHPNFFSWSRVKGLFWRDEALAGRQELALLSANFRNGAEATRIANALLKIKHRRFGSIDRESNFLVEAVGAQEGAVALLADQEAVTRELDQRIRRSTRVAVLVMREEDKAAARKRFSTPLLFCVHEAKGLEYESIVLYRFVSDHRAEFSEIAQGVQGSDLEAGALAYRRAADKSDKSLEVYKFFVNALYVALTRALENVYVVESDTSHALFALLGLAPAGRVEVRARAATLEDWQREARKLELQGKQEQAEAIRRTVLKQTPVPWPVLGEARFRETLVKVFREQAPGGKTRQLLYDHAACFDEPMLARWLAAAAGFGAERDFDAHKVALGRRHFMPYYARNLKEVLRQCDEHGVEHRTPMNLTPLMAAAFAGNLPLVEALLARGADPQAVDDFGCNALHWAMREAFRDPAFARGSFAAIYDLVAPSAVDVQWGERLVRIDRHLSEYFLFQTLWALYRSRFTQAARRAHCAFETAVLLAAWEHLPANVVPPWRKRRQHLSGVLARNEVERDYAYNRGLFKRTAQGWYQFNPRLAVRRKAGETEAWVPILLALNLPLIHEVALDSHRERVAAYLAEGGLPEPGCPIAAERLDERRRAEEEEEEARARREAAERAALERRRAQERERARAALAPEPGWGTPEARQREIERLRQEIERRKAAREAEDF
jgi:hypothetical protein